MHKWLIDIFFNRTHINSSAATNTMVLKIYGNIFASCTQRVITVLKELGIAYELVTVVS